VRLAHPSTTAIEAAHFAVFDEWAPRTTASTDNS
jgi:hypothetical protein